MPGYAGYAVTADGQLYGPRGHRMRPKVTPDGHLKVLTRRGNRPRTLFLHRAVLLAWVGPPGPGEESLHGDGDPANNVLGNLRWGTRVENHADRARHGVLVEGERQHAAKLTAADVREIRRLRGTVGIRALARRYGVDHSAVSRAAAGRSWKGVR